MKNVVQRNVQLKAFGVEKLAREKQSRELEEKQKKIEDGKETMFAKGSSNNNRFIDDLISYHGHVGLDDSDAVESNARDKLNDTIAPEIWRINDYIKDLKIRVTRRFQPEPGPLYDYEKGWNPGFVVRQEDLMTRIPMKPFSTILAGSVPFGKPISGPFEGQKGIMPFSWI